MFIAIDGSMKSFYHSLNLFIGLNIFFIGNRLIQLIKTIGSFKIYSLKGCLGNKNGSSLQKPIFKSLNLRVYLHNVVPVYIDTSGGTLFSIVICKTDCIEK